MCFNPSKIFPTKSFSKIKKRLIKFIELPLKRKFLFIEVFILTGIARLSIIIIPFKYLSLVMGRRNFESTYKLSDESIKRVSDISYAVKKMSRFTPWESKCLVQALTAQLILRQSGIASTLYLGIARESANTLLAHAWLRCGNMIVTGGDVKDRFKMVTQFASLTKEYNHLECH